MHQAWPNPISWTQTAPAPTKLGRMVTWVAASNRAKNSLSTSPLQSSLEYLNRWIWVPFGVRESSAWPLNIFCKASGVKVEVEKVSGHRKEEWCHTSKQAHSPSIRVVVCLLIGQPNLQCFQSTWIKPFIRWQGHYWHLRFQLSRPQCFSAGAIEFAHFGWCRFDLLSNFKAYNLIVSIYCPTVMTKISHGINKKAKGEFSRQGGSLKELSQTYLGFSFSISTENPTWGSKSWNSSQYIINVFPQVFVYLRKSPGEGWASLMAVRTHHKKHLGFYCHLPTDLRLAWQTVLEKVNS